MIQDRTKLGLEVQRSLEKALDNRGIEIVSVQVEDVAFSDVYETAVENRMKSIVLQYQAEAEKQKRITNADAAAYEVKAAADAQAHAIEVQGNAQATAIKARADALPRQPRPRRADRGGEVERHPADDDGARRSRAVPAAAEMKPPSLEEGTSPKRKQSW